MASSPRAESVRCNISDIVKLPKTCMRRRPGSGKKPPRDVPPGHLAVTVGEARRRFVTRADYLNHPLLKQLLDEVYEEYGQRKEGPLAIPCDEFLFQNIILPCKPVLPQREREEIDVDEAVEGLQSSSQQLFKCISVTRVL